jgi:hypothetical protein
MWICTTEVSHTGTHYSCTGARQDGIIYMDIGVLLYCSLAQEIELAKAFATLLRLI